MRFLIVLAAISILAAASWAEGPKPIPSADSTQLKDYKDAPRIKVDTKGNVTQVAAKHHEDTITTASGLKYIVLAAGKGDSAVVGKMAEVHYTIWLADEKGARGKKIQSSVDENSPFAFKLGAGLVIKGWEEGIAGMKVGEKRTLIIKPELAWGATGFRDMVPPNATVIFDVELLSVFEPKKMH